MTSAFPSTPTPAAPDVPDHQRVRSYHPRRGRMTDAQRTAMEALWPVYGRDIDGEPLDLAEFFGSPRPVVLEIGFGMGDATAAMAEADPGTGILGVDIHTPGHGNLLRLVAAKGLENVRVAQGDAVILLRDMLEPASLAGLRVYFPDPWPKKRHHKRRLIQPEFLRLAVSRLAPGALVHCATDWEPYAEQMLEVLSAEPGLVNAYPEGDGWAPRPDWRPMTKFERQGLARGHVVRDLLFRRAGGPAPSAPRRPSA
ncbi:tRNA (guanosine(46)-N7)-methyltransferase TrmB [Phaeacidiphilus oryzae]|uniref:tRNA (guanosine(46)-N7)-methyltransferase TrmB n=1 Tax=Phaeacidiphilus oryzae TaxID=348818 RepID=UPI000A8315AB|nr:tRNA (guanosine(46)-N7)-methyltransferase TrmB [Phaeacidiphilus oryzae]